MRTAMVDPYGPFLEHVLEAGVVPIVECAHEVSHRVVAGPLQGAAAHLAEHALEHLRTRTDCATRTLPRQRATRRFVFVVGEELCARLSVAGRVYGHQTAATTEQQVPFVLRALLLLGFRLQSKIVPFQSQPS